LGAYVLFLRSRIEQSKLIPIKAPPLGYVIMQLEKGRIAMISVHPREGGAFLVNILEWWRSWRRTRNGLAELHRSRAGLELLARDVNLSPWDLRAVAAKWPDGSDLLGRRLTTLRLDPEQFSSVQLGALRDLERVCTLCGSKSHCEHDLERNASTAAWRDYCFNVATLDALQSESTSRKP
jgi:uncharacterized protein YjiS (DUF1127 family)